MIEAAGGVVLRGVPSELEVLIVHRVRHRDWSLPKGKLDPGEDATQAAVREVEEETGVRVDLGDELPELLYPTEQGPKRVRWYRMTAVSGDPTQRPADGEVDVARWAGIDEAVDLLTYEQDVVLLYRAIAKDVR